MKAKSFARIQRNLSDEKKQSNTNKMISAASNPFTRRDPIDGLYSDEVFNTFLRKTIGIQSKADSSEQGDAYEEEADRVAEQLTTSDTVSNNTNTSGLASTETVQTKQASGGTHSGSKAQLSRIATSVGNTTNGGVPLPPTTRTHYEKKMGRDFSNVRVHAGKDAHVSAESLNARAYTIGNDIVFSEGEYNPGTVAGEKLIAHELVHTIQQNNSGQKVIQKKGKNQRTIRDWLDSSAGNEYEKKVKLLKEADIGFKIIKKKRIGPSNEWEQLNETSDDHLDTPIWAENQEFDKANLGFSIYINGKWGWATTYNIHTKLNSIILSKTEGYEDEYTPEETKAHKGKFTEKEGRECAYSSVGACLATMENAARKMTGVFPERGGFSEFSTEANRYANKYKSVKRHRILHEFPMLERVKQGPSVTTVGMYLEEKGFAKHVFAGKIVEKDGLKRWEVLKKILDDEVGDTKDNYAAFIVGVGMTHSATIMYNRDKDTVIAGDQGNMFGKGGYTKKEALSALIATYGPLITVFRLNKQKQD